LPKDVKQSSFRLANDGFAPTKNSIILMGGLDFLFFAVILLLDLEQQKQFFPFFTLTRQKKKGHPA